MTWLAHRTLHNALQNGENPHKAAALICKIAQTPAPLGRYGAGPQSTWIPLLKTLLPQRLFDTALRRSYHLPR